MPSYKSMKIKGHARQSGPKSDAARFAPFVATAALHSGTIHWHVAERMLALGMTGGPRHPGKPSVTALVHGANINYKTAYYLLRDPSKIEAVHLPTLAKLCNFLRCTPGDLLSYEQTAATPQLTLADFFRNNPGADPYASTLRPTRETPISDPEDHPLTDLGI